MGSLFGLSTQGAFLLSAQDARALPSDMLGQIIGIISLGKIRQPRGGSNPGTCGNIAPGTVGSCQLIQIQIYIGSAWGDAGYTLSPVAPSGHADMRRIITGRTSSTSRDMTPSVVDTHHCTPSPPPTIDSQDIYKSSSQTSPKDSGDWPVVFYKSHHLNPGASNEYWLLEMYENNTSNVWTLDEYADMTTGS